MKIDIPHGIGSHETGCHTALGNNLALYVQTTRHLQDKCEELFVSTLARKLNWSGLSKFNVLMHMKKVGIPFLKSVIEQYEYKILTKHSHVTIQPCEKGDFIAWLAREFDAWEMDNDPPRSKEA